MDITDSKSTFFGEFSNKIESIAFVYLPITNVYFSFLLFFSPAPLRPSCVTFLSQVRAAFVCLLVSLSHVVFSAAHWF